MIDDRLSLFSGGGALPVVAGMMTIVSPESTSLILPCSQPLIFEICRLDSRLAICGQCAAGCCARCVWDLRLMRLSINLLIAGDGERADVHEAFAGQKPFDDGARQARPAERLSKLPLDELNVVNLRVNQASALKV